MLTEVPASVIVIGGGAIGCEFASMLGDLGATVTILEAMPKILPGCDADITRVVSRSFARRGIEIRTGVRAEGHTPGSSGTSVGLGEGESVEADLVVVSVGRRPLSDTLGLVGTSVEVDHQGYLLVDERYRTGEPGVYAVGDVIATPALAHVAFAEAMFVIEDLLGGNPTRIDDSLVPWCIYCHPEVAFAGMSEERARLEGREVVVAKHRFGGNGRALILGEADGIVKVIAEKTPDGSAGRILGVQMVGPWVTEQLGQASLAINQGLTAGEVAGSVQPHPTLGELFGESVLALTGRSLYG